MTGRAIVIRGDARRLPLPDESVDLICTSPPYWALRDYRDGDESLKGQIGAEATPQEYLESLWECTREWMRVLKPSGSLWMNLGDKYANPSGSGRRNLPGGAKTSSQWKGSLLHRRDSSGLPAKSLMGLPWRYALGCIDQLGMILRRDLIWEKATPLPESVTDRCSTSHEYWFHFTRQQQYFAALDEIRDPHGAPQRSAGAAAFSARNANLVRTGTGDYEGPNPLGKIPGSVWTVPHQPLYAPDHLAIQHHAAFPSVFPRRLIQGWCPPDGVVLDPFGGTGTTALAAAMLGRSGLSLDRSAGYCRLAQWRTTDPGERARALGLPKPPPVVDGQAALFEETA